MLFQVYNISGPLTVPFNRSKLKKLFFIGTHSHTETLLSEIYLMGLMKSHTFWRNYLLGTIPLILTSGFRGNGNGSNVTYSGVSNNC